MTTSERPQIDLAELERMTQHDSRDPIPPAMLAVAHALAKAHGHTWGMFDIPEAGNVSPRDIAADSIRRHYSADDAEWGRWLGIDTPTIEPSGSICHTTGSGRLTWQVLPDRVRLLINRPHRTGRMAPDPIWPDMSAPELVAVTVLIATVSYADYSVVIETPPASERVLARHLATLNTAVEIVSTALEGDDLGCLDCDRGGHGIADATHDHADLFARRDAAAGVPQSLAELGPWWRDTIINRYPGASTVRWGNPNGLTFALVYDERDTLLGEITTNDTYAHNHPPRAAGG